MEQVIMNQDLDQDQEPRYTLGRQNRFDSAEEMDNYLNFQNMKTINPAELEMPIDAPANINPINRKYVNGMRVAGSFGIIDPDEWTWVAAIDFKVGLRTGTQNFIQKGFENHNELVLAMNGFLNALNAVPHENTNQ